MDKRPPEIKRCVELATHCTEESIQFNIDEWKQEYNDIELDISEKEEKLLYIKEKIGIWEKALEIKNADKK